MIDVKSFEWVRFMYRLGFAAVSAEGQSLWMYADSNKERNALGTGESSAVDGWLTRVEKLGSCSRLPSLNSPRDDRARHQHPCLLADRRPALGFRAIYGHAASGQPPKMPVKAAFAF